MLRVTTANAFDASIGNLQQRQRDMVDAQQQMTTGKRVLKASDDPTAAARAERADALIQRATATQRALDASRNAMKLTEAALADAGELMQQARELVVAAGNASYSDAERADVANRLSEIRKQLLGVANRSDGTGGYVFGGQGASKPPFLDGLSGVDFTGVAGSVRVASDEPLPLTLDGEQVWQRALSGNGQFETSVVQGTGAWIDAGRVTDPAALTGGDYQIVFSDNGGTAQYSVYSDGNTVVPATDFVSGQAIAFDGLAVTINGKPVAGDRYDIAPATHDLSLFDTLDRVVKQLETPLRTTASIAQGVQLGLRDIDASMNHLQAARSMTGEVLNRIDGVETRVADLKLFGQNTQSDAVDLDMVQAISDFKNQQTGYQAALQTYATMQRMSLFDYLQS